MRAAELLSMQQEEPATHTELARAVGMSPVRLIALLRLAGPNDNLPSTSGLLKVREGGAGRVGGSGRVGGCSESRCCLGCPLDRKSVV